MASKFIVPFELPDFLGTPADNADSGFVLMYVKYGWLKKLAGGTERDLVLDHPLDGFDSVTAVGPISQTDTVLQAFKKLQSGITGVTLTGDVIGTASYDLGGNLVISTTYYGTLPPPPTPGIYDTTVADSNLYGNVVISGLSNAINTYNWSFQDIYHFSVTGNGISLGTYDDIAAPVVFTNATLDSNGAILQFQNATVNNQLVIDGKHVALEYVENDGTTTVGIYFGHKQVQIVDDNVHQGSASNGSVFTLTDASIGQGEWLPLVVDWTTITGAPAFLTAESDTLDSVTTRNAVTTNSITVGNSTILGATYAQLLIRPTSGNNAEITFQNSSYGAPKWGIRATGSPDAQSGDLVIQHAGVTFPVTITSAENFLIGTTTDAGYKLDVNGSIRSGTSGYYSGNGTINNVPLIKFNTNSLVQVDPQGYGAVTGYNLTVNGVTYSTARIATDSYYIAKGGSSTPNTTFNMFGIGRPDTLNQVTSLAGIGGVYEGANWFNGLGLVFFVSTGADISGGGSITEKMRLKADGSLVVNTLAGTGTRMVVASSTGVLSTQTIPSGSGLTIGSSAITSGTAGRVLFEGTGNVLQESANLLWDSVNNRLSVGGTNSSYTLDVTGSQRISGILGVGTPATGFTIAANKIVNGSATAGNFSASGFIQSDVTSLGYGYTSTLNTAASAFTLNSFYHFNASQGTLGSGSAVTNQYGFYAASSIANASTLNIGFYGDITASGTKNFNIYMNGGARNYFAGNIGIGTTTLTDYTSLAIAKNITGSTFSYAVSQTGTVQSDVTAQAYSFYSASNTQATTFTLGSFFHYRASPGTRGAGSVVSNEYGFFSDDFTGSTAGYGFYGMVTLGTGKFNLYMSGSADNFLAGNLGIGQSPTSETLAVAKNITSTINYGINSKGVVQSGTTTAASIVSQLNTAANGSTYTVTDYIHYKTEFGTIGSNSSVTNAYGYYMVPNTYIGVTNVYAFYSGMVSGSNRWNLYMSGSANNYLSGNLKIGATNTLLASAILNVESSTQGVLIPRMTSVQRAAISSPVQGLLVYQTDSTEGTYEYTTASGWRIINAAGGPGSYLTIANPAYTGVLTTGTLTYTATNHIASLQSSVNAYNQFVIQNSNAGASASSDVVVNNDVSTDTTFYGDFGMNSSGFSGTGSFSLPSAVYLASAGGDLVLGTYTSNAIRFVINSGTSDAFRIGTTGNLMVNQSTDAGYRLDVNGTSRFQSNVLLGVGTATNAPLSMTVTSAALKTTAAAGDFEIDSLGVPYYTYAASSRGLIESFQMISLSSTYTLTSQTAAQKIFNSSTNGAVTVQAGVSYYVECFFSITSMSATTGSYGFAFGGTATFTSLGWHSMGYKTGTITTGTTALATYNSSLANATLVTANTSGSGMMRIWGILRVNAGGTIIPQVSLGVAAAAIIGANSYFKITPIGSGSVTTLGNWS